jgi:hypothetical protein
VKHYYSYDCWKCDKRHGGEWHSESADPVVALAEIREHWDANEPDAWDYEFALHSKAELNLITGNVNEGRS